MTFSTFTRRAVIAAIAAGTACVAALPALAQNFPSRPIKIIVAFAPGGTSDTLSRLYGQKMSEILNTPVIIENRPGANQVTAIRAVLAAPPDGYTLYAAVGSGLTQNPALRKDLPYDPLKDFTFIGLAANNPGVIFVSNDLPVHNLPELFAYAKANPGKLNYGSAGIGTAGHLAAEALMAAGNFKMTHIPYKNDAEVIRETMSGSVHLGIFTTLNTVQPIKAGRIRGISVTTPKRLPYLPDVPGLSESGLSGLEAMDPHTFAAFVGPAGMPPDVVNKLNDAINKASLSPDVATRVRDTLNAEPMTSTPASFRQSVEKQLALWRELGKTIKLSE